MNDSVAGSKTPRSGDDHRERLFALCVTAMFVVALSCAAVFHAMWRDEWIPLVIAEHTDGYAAFFAEVRYLGRNGFFSFVWLLYRLGGLWLFKASLIAISTAGVYLFARYAPFSRSQRALFAAGYYPLYEYGTILRDYGSILTLSTAVAVLLSNGAPRPFLFGVTLALLAQTNAFGVLLAAVFGVVFLLDASRRGLLSRQVSLSPAFIGGASIAAVSIAVAAWGFVQPPDVTRAVLGGEPRSDSHVVRLFESLPFPLRAWFPIPAFGTWNSQILDPWPKLQIGTVAILSAWMLMVVRRSFTATVLFCMGMLAMLGILCHLPWTALRYHGPYFILLVMSWWLVERDEQRDQVSIRRKFLDGGLLQSLTSTDARRGFLTAVLAVQAVVGITFVMQERLVPFSGSAAAARLIREREPPDTLVIVDPDYAAIALAGCLSREVYVAGRNELGSFTKVDSRRRLGRLSPEELGAVVENQLRQQRRDVVLVTNYEVMMPPEVGTLIGVTPSITDERYYIFRMRYRRDSQ